MSAPSSPAPPRFASRTDALTPFLAMEILERAVVLERSGVSIAHLEVGEPEFAPPPAAVRACRDALAADDTGYTDSRGLCALREAIAANLAARFGRSVPAERVLVTQGTSNAMTLVFACLVEPGDEVLIPTPHYPCYPNFVRVMGARPVFVPTDAASGWRIDPDRVRAALTPRTRAIVVGSPANPTGAVQPREVMAALASLGPPLVSDEIYDGLLYDGAKNTSALEVSDEALRARRLLEALCDDRIPAGLARGPGERHAAAPDAPAESLHLGELVRAARGDRGPRGRSRDGGGHAAGLRRAA